jgi:hypothetical protein
MYVEPRRPQSQQTGNPGGGSYRHLLVICGVKLRLVLSYSIRLGEKDPDDDRTAYRRSPYPIETLIPTLVIENGQLLYVSASNMNVITALALR